MDKKGCSGCLYTFKSLCEKSPWVRPDGLCDEFKNMYKEGKRTSALSDRRPSKLMRLDLISVKMSTPEQMLEAYNSLVDAYNTLIDGYNRFLDERIAELKEEEE